MSSPTVWVVAFYVFVVVVVTFPYILHPATTIIGPNGGDVSSSIGKYEATIREGANPFTTPRWNEVAVPVGAQANVGVDRVSFLSVLFLWWGSLTVGPIAIHSLESILGYLLTSIIAFVFIRRVTGSWLAGAVTGFIFGFSPHMLAIARAAPSYTHMWLLLLPIMAFWSLLKHGPNKQRVALAALSVVPAVFWTPYYALHAGVVGGTCLVVALYLWTRQKQNLRNVAVQVVPIVAVWVLALASFWYIGTHSPSTQVPQRTLQEAYSQAAHPLMYVTPGFYSIWGHHLNTWLTTNVSTTIGTNSYVGVSALALGGFAVYALSRRQRTTKTKARDDKHDGVRIALVLSATTLVVCFLFSLPPTVQLANITLPTPNYLVVEAVPPLRAGQRFVMPMMGALAVLAGIGMYYATRLSRPRLRSLIIILVPVIIVLDLWALPPKSATTIPIYPSMKVLASQPKGLTAHYQPGSSILGPPGQFACTMQMQHQQPLVNDCVLGRPDSNINQPPQHLLDLHYMPLCDQLVFLRDTWGVKYIITGTQNYAVRRCAERLSPKAELIAGDYEFVVLSLTKP